MLDWWLSVFFLINGTWVAGDKIQPPGWSPRSYPSEAECRERKRVAEKQCEQFPLRYKAAWVCSPDRPAVDPPAEVETRDC